MKNIIRISLLLIIGLVLFLQPILSQEINVLSQTIRGKVVDKESQTTLPGATVMILNTDPLLVTVSDNDGYYRIENVPVGRYNIQASYIGYESFIISDLQFTTSKEVVLEIQLKEEAFALSEVVVKPNKDKEETINSMSMVSARTFSAEETQRYAGGVDDPARMASAFAGVSVGNIQDNSIIIRGNSPKGVLWRLEGVDIPSPSHFSGANVAGGGFTTLFSNHLLSNSDFFTGAFPAEYGNALGGVFDMRLRKGNDQKREYAFQAGLMGLDFAAEGPFVTGKEFVFSKKKDKTRILGINARATISGGHRIVPVNEELSHMAKDIYYDWTNPYVNQNPTDFFLDITVLYRKNKKRYSSIWAVQIKNATGTPSNFLYQYNLKENRIENTSQSIVVPNISYKIEF